jgi:hypothetical protein
LGVVDRLPSLEPRRESEIGVACGEAFRQHNGHPYPHENMLEGNTRGRHLCNRRRFKTLGSKSE